MFYIILKCTIEYVKNYLLSSIFIKYKGKKRVVLSWFFMAFTMAIIYLLDKSNDWSSVVGSIVVMITLTSATNSYKNIGTTFLSYAVISSIDIFISVYFIIFWNLDIDELSNSKFWGIGLNLITLLGILIIYILYNKKYNGRIILLSKKLFIIIIMCAMSVVLYSSLLQFRAADYWTDTYNDMFVVAFNSISLTMFIVFVIMFINLRRNTILKIENLKDQEIIIAQEKYYKLMLEKEEETKAFRHDIMNHLYCMQLLLDEKEYTQLNEYMSELIGTVQKISYDIKTGNDLLNAIVMNIVNDHSGVVIEWDGIIPPILSISQPELCTVFYNLLKNAAEAVADQDNRCISVKIKLINNMFSVVIKNHSKEPIKEKGLFQTKKSEPGHGYGINNVKKIIDKNNGEFVTKYSDGLFIADILLPIA